MAARTLPVCALPGCQEQCWLEQSGKVHQYCGITHAREAKKRGVSGVGAGHQSGTCQLAGCSELASFDDRRNCWHDFCSRSHACFAIASGQWPRGGGGKGASTCRLPGCRAGVYRDPATGKESNFCSKRHRDSSTGVPSMNPYVVLVFRGGTTSASDFTLSVLADAHRDFVSIRSQFNSNWIKPGAPTVLRILEVEVPEAVSKRFSNYSKSSVAERQFHGTGCSDRCNFFVDLTGSPCNGMDCKLCSICTQGFKITGNVGTTAKRTGFPLRYGEGIYVSSVSGKANDYAGLSEKKTSDGRRLRCMVVAQVCAGKAFHTKDGSLPPHKCPPANYDSVVGDAGGVLNYGESVVYKEEAILPTHLIVYYC